MSEQSVQAGDSYVADQFGPLAHDLGGDFRLGRDGQIGRAGGNYRQDGLGGRQLFLFQGDGPGQFVVADVRELLRFFQGLEYIGFGPGCQDVVALGGETLEYLDYVFGGLAGAEDDFGKTPPDLPVVVDAREAQILERQMPELLDRLVDTQLIAFDLLQQFFYLFSLNISPFEFIVMNSRFIDNELSTTNYELLAFGSSVKSAKSPALNL